MNNLRKNFFLDVIYLFCFIFLIEFNVSAGDTIIMPSLSIDSLDKVVIVDRLIAQRAYENIKANLPADSGLDFNEIEERIRFYEADLKKNDAAIYNVLLETYEKMKNYVTNPQSDFIKSIIEPGSVVFNGRSPLPAAIYSDTEWINKFNLYNNKTDSIAKPLSYRKINEFEKFLSDKAKQTLKLIRMLPDKTAIAQKKMKQ